MICMKWHEKIYALYIGETNICDGTLPEIAAKTGKRLDTLRWMTYASYQERLKTRKTTNITELVLIEDVEA